MTAAAVVVPAPAPAGVPDAVVSAADPAAAAVVMAGSKRLRDGPASAPPGAVSFAGAPAPFAHGAPALAARVQSTLVLPPVTLASAARPIVTIKPSAAPSRRPQLKYDPSIPMTKEQTSQWRREQRRRRNRESAAACRRRQRDRIDELEGESAAWRRRVEDALEKLKAQDSKGAAELEAKFAEDEARKRAKVVDERCATPPLGHPHEVAILAASPPSSATQIQSQIFQSHVVTPKFVPPVVPSSAPGDEVLHFLPILERDPKDSSFVQAQAGYDAGLMGPKAGLNSGLKGLKARTQKKAKDQASKKKKTTHKQRRHSTEISRPAAKIARAASASQVSSSSRARPAPSLIPQVSRVPAQVPVSQGPASGASVLLPRAPSLAAIEAACDDLLRVVPDSCLSLTERKTMPFPEACPSLVPRFDPPPSSSAPSSVPSTASSSVDALPAIGASSAPSVTTDESDHDDGLELGEFLLDAVNWL